MLLIFGVGERDASLATVSVTCDVCGNHAGHHVIKRVRKISLFFVPLIPLGSRYLDVCSVCGRAWEISRTQAEAAVQSARPHLR